jgi:hypothetical protein
VEKGTVKHQELPIGQTNEPIQCPQCGGSNFSNTEVEAKDTVAKIFVAVFGFFSAAVGYFLDWGTYIENPIVAIMVRIFVMFMGSWMVWDAVTGLPLPISGIKLIGRRTETHAVCAGCGHEWKLTEQEARTSIKPLTDWG